MTRRVIAAALLLGSLASQTAAETNRQRRSPAAAEMPAAIALRAILAAEDARLPLPEDLHSPSIDALRARQREDLRLLIELAESTDKRTGAAAIRALGRLERRDLIPELLRHLPSIPAETAAAIAQAFRGGPVPGDTATRQVDVALDALVLAGGLPVDPRQRPGPIGPIAVAIGRLPFERADQVQTAEAYVLSLMRAADSDGQLRPVLPEITRAVEILARRHTKLSPLGADTVDQLRSIVANRRHDNPEQARLNAMAALLNAQGVDADTLRVAASVSSRTTDSVVSQLRRLAAVALGGSASVLAPTERANLLATLLADRSPVVRVEAVRAWARQEARENGCQRLLDALKDPNQQVATAAIDAIGDACKDDVNVTDRLAVEARPPGPNDWQRASHALVALAKRSPGRVFIPLLAGHVQHVTWQVRMYAAQAAAITNEVTALERLAYDRNNNVREATLAALRRLKGAEAEPHLLAALAQDDDQLLRTAAIESKGLTASPQLPAALLESLRRVTADKRETSRDTRLALLERLAELGTADQAGALVPLLRDYDIQIAQFAAALLQRWTGRLQEIDPQLLPRPPLPTAADLSTPPARMKLRSGTTLTIRLFGEDAPLTVARFVRLARAGYYNGLTFHRVVPNFVLQGGSPAANEYAGDALYVHDEIGQLSHLRGTFGLSTRGHDTGDAQFFVNLVDNPRLDFEYTIFGMVDSADQLDDIIEGDIITAISFDKEEDK